MSNGKPIPAELRSFIASQALFKTLTKSSMDLLMQDGLVYSYQSSEYIIEENQKNPYLFLILSGSAEARINKTPVGKIEAGELAGEISMAGISPPVGSVVAESEVEVAAFPLATIDRIAKSDQKFFQRLREAGFQRISG
jgi:signal-transduction protein with cAMP-binding, CBS, and nucleotidyltransferase domain